MFCLTGEILYLHLHSLAIRTEMRPCTGCQSRFQLCLALLAYADRGPSGYQRKHHKNPQNSEIQSLQRHLFCSSSCTFLCSLPTFEHAALTIAKAQARVLLKTSVPIKANRCRPSTSQYGTCTWSYTIFQPLPGTLQPIFHALTGPNHISSLPPAKTQGRHPTVINMI